MKKGISTSVLLAVIAATLLLAGGLIRDVGGELPTEEGVTVLRRVINFVSDSISKGVTVRRDIDINGSLTHNGSFEFENINPEKMSIRYLPAETDVVSDDKSIVVDGDVADMEVVDFRGSVEIDHETVILEGETTSLSSGGTTFEGDFIDVTMNGTFKRVEIGKAEIKEIGFGDPHGILDVGRSLSVTLDGTETTVHAFSGDIQFEPQKVFITGETSKITSGNKTISAN